MPQEVAERFLPASEYARAQDVDWAAAQAVQEGFSNRYLAEVR